MKDVYIIGSYSTAFGRRPGDSVKDLAREAYEGVLADAGLDDPERIEYEKMTRIVRLVHQTSWNVANADGRPAIEGMASRPRS